MVSCVGAFDSLSLAQKTVAGAPVHPTTQPEVISPPSLVLSLVPTHSLCVLASRRLASSCLLSALLVSGTASLLVSGALLRCCSLNSLCLGLALKEVELLGFVWG